MRTVECLLVMGVAGWMGCDDGGAAPHDAGAHRDGALDAGPAPPDADLTPPSERADAQPALTLRSVSGDLTYAEVGEGAGGHLYSVQIDGQLRLRITSQPGLWTHHAVGPDPTYVVAVRHGDADGDGRPDASAPGEVWIINVRARREFPISPAGCDAGIGGVGWQNETLVSFAMDCGDEPAAVYLASREDTSRDRSRLLKVSHNEEPVRDVFPAVGTSLFAYAVETRRCAGGRCIVKPQIWVGDTEADLACQVTDGDLSFTDLGTLTAGGELLGDRNPSFTGDLSGLLFSRNVGEKPNGPGGHFDLFRVGFDRQAFFAGRPTCAVPESLTNLSETLGDAYPARTGDELPADERFPQGAAGRAPPGALLYTVQTHEGGLSSAIWVRELGAEPRPLTPVPGLASHARWIVTEYHLSGER